ncbi:hypothetical protein DFH06DRAFT_1149472 [Mycena polygramma]|nr:hypothetical protein DFH06DRAFT_1149472 [Mycena polygramma]
MTPMRTAVDYGQRTVGTPVSDAIPLKSWVTGTTGPWLSSYISRLEGRAAEGTPAISWCAGIGKSPLVLSHFILIAIMVANGIRRKSRGPSNSQGVKKKVDLVKRREASRRYYQRAAKKAYRRQWDPPKKSKNTSAMLVTPPPTARSNSGEPGSSDASYVRRGAVDVDLLPGFGSEIAATEPLTPDEDAEDAARAALTTLYHVSRRRGEVLSPLTPAAADREPKSLTEIAAYESSVEDSPGQSERDSLAQVEDSMADVAELHRARRAAARARSAEIAAKTSLEEARLDAEKAARMRVVVESSRSLEAVASIHRERGSVEVERWLETMGG